MESEKSEQLQDHLNKMAYNLSASNFNVRSYKKQHHSKPIRLSTHSQNKTKHIVSNLETEPIQLQRTFYPQSHTKTVAQGLNKSLKYRSTFIEPYPVKKNDFKTTKRNKSFFSRATDRYATKGSHFSAPHKTESPADSATKLQTYETAWSKGKIKEKYIQGWVNSICIEFMVNEYFDKNIPNCALKKLGIDVNSLVAKGIKPKDVSRLYRSLFVFGMGFYQLVGQITNGDMRLVKIVWKIYSMVLEYCSRGSLQTSIGELEKQYTGKLLELTAQLEKKQNIIEKNEELNQKKNNQIFKEIKFLRQQNVNISNQKSVLFDQYNATEQAFNQQVQLRLKFEAKINQLYSLHRQMGIKHQKLFHELVSKTEELRGSAEKYFQVASRISEYREVQIDLKDQLSLFKQKYKRQAACLQESNKEIINLTTKVSKLEYDVESIRNMYQEIKLREKQWKIQRSNMEVVIEMRQKSTKEAYKEYQITLEQNNRLNILLSDQRKVMEQYEKDKKNFNSKVISIVSENSYNKRKLQELRKTHQAMQQEYQKLLEQKDDIEEKNQIFRKNESNLQSHFEAVQGNIQEMHKLNMTQSNQLTQLRNFHKNMDNFLNKKNQMIEDLIKEKQKIKNQYQELKISYEKLLSNQRLAQEDIARTKQQLLQKEIKLNILQENYEEKRMDMMTKIKQLSDELQLNKYSLQKILQEYKDQKFERNSLNNIYNQTLRMVELKDQEQKNLNVRISLMEGDLTNERNKYLVLERNMMCFIKDFGEIQDQLETVLQNQRDLIYQKAEYRHPMIMEDLQARVNHLVQIREKLEDEVYNLLNVISKQRNSYNHTLERTHSSYKWQITKLKKQTEKIIESLKNQNIYLKEQNSKQKDKLTDLQALAQTYRKKIYEKSTSERQEVYKFMIEQKKTQIQNLLAEIDKLQDELVKNKKILAQVSVAHQRSLFNSNDEFKKSVEDSIRKQIAHEYQLKMRQMQRNIRHDYSRRQQVLKQERQLSIQGMSIDDIMKIKKVKPEELMTQLSQRMGANYVLKNQKGRMKELNQYKQQIQKRRQLSKLMKNAYQYYDQQ